MTSPVAARAAPPAAAPGRAALTLTFEFDQLLIEREVVDVETARRRWGCALVQSFTVPLPDGRRGRCWLPTAVAIRRGPFGRAAVAWELNRRARRHGLAHVVDRLARPHGLALDRG